jgi:hypothetical protein
MNANASWERNKKEIYFSELVSSREVVMAQHRDAIPLSLLASIASLTKSTAAGNYLPSL